MALAGVGVGSGLDGGLGGGLDMMEGLLGMGLGAGMVVGGGATTEDVRGKRLEEVLDILKADKGRLSESGLDRLVKRYKTLELAWTGVRGSGKSARTAIIAGNTVGLDIVFENDVVKKVEMQYVDSPDSVTRHTKAGGEALFRDLALGPSESQLTKKLDRFATNLERLSRLDELSKLPELDCHEAIAGIYESLERLHHWEVQRLKEGEEMKGRDEEELEKTAMCTASGKPVMHARDRLGISLDYWRERRFLKGSGKEKTYALLIECAKPEYLNYSPIRVSQHWISANIERAKDPLVQEMFAFTTGPVLDWLQPDDTLISDEPRSDGMEGLVPNRKFPEVTFVAKFDPPLMVPEQIAIQIYNCVALTLDNTFTNQPVLYDELLLPRYPDEISDLNKRELSRATTIPIFSKEGEKSTSEHRTNLLIEKRDYGRVLSEIPFAHPQQLVEWLPVLRQAAFTNSLLTKSFGPTTRPCVKRRDEAMSKRSEFDMFMRGEVASTETGVDVQLQTQPVPRLTVAFPFTKARKGQGRKGYAQVVFEIKLNGGVEVTSQNILDGEVDGGKGRKLTAQDLARMLELTEDIGVWVEFVKRRLG